jgi:hypothetical protein
MDLVELAVQKLKNIEIFLRAIEEISDVDIRALNVIQDKLKKKIKQTELYEGCPKDSLEDLKCESDEQDEVDVDDVINLYSWEEDDLISIRKRRYEALKEPQKK